MDIVFDARTKFKGEPTASAFTNLFFFFLV